MCRWWQVSSAGAAGTCKPGLAAHLAAAAVVTAAWEAAGWEGWGGCRAT
jgi:hypothetical protein